MTSRQNHLSRGLARALGGAAFVAGAGAAIQAPMGVAAGGGANTATLTAVSFASTSHGWAVGGDRAGAKIILHTTDGSLWAAQTAPAGIGDLNSVWFPTTTVGYAVTSNPAAIIKTSNGGANWATQTFPAAVTQARLNGVTFTDATTGWAVGDGTVNSVSGGVIIHTSDGATWAAQTVAAAGGFINAVSFANATTGWAVGGMRIGNTQNNQAAIFSTTNGGTTWTPQTPPAGVGPLTSVSFPSASQGWAVSGDGSILHTSNGGTTWTAQASPVVVGLTSVSFADASNGWTVGFSTSGPGGAILHTNNGGGTWTQQSLPPSNHGVSAVAAVSGTQATAVGQGGNDANTGCADPSIVSTANSGNTWNEHITPTCGGSLPATGGQGGAAPPPPNTPPGAYTTVLGNAVASDTAAVTLTLTSGSSTITLTIPAGALPAGTTITVYAGDSSVLAPLLPAGKQYVTGFAVSWQTPGGTSPDATSPLTLAITDPGITAASTTYQANSNSLTPYPSQLTSTTTSVGFTVDPGFVVASPSIPVPSAGARIPQPGSGLILLGVLILGGAGAAGRRRRTGGATG